jgi:hypothetical protein
MDADNEDFAIFNSSTLYTTGDYFIMGTTFLPPPVGWVDFSATGGMAWISGDAGVFPNAAITTDPTDIVTEVLYYLYVDTDSNGDIDTAYKSSVGAPIDISFGQPWTTPYPRRTLTGDTWDIYSIPEPLGAGDRMTWTGQTTDVPLPDRLNIVEYGMEFVTQSFNPGAETNYLSIYIDNLTYALIPEPTTLAFLASASLLLAFRRGTQKRS